MCSIGSLHPDRTGGWRVLWLGMVLAEGLLPLTWHMGWGNSGLAQGSLPWWGWKASPSLHSIMTLHCKSSLLYLSVLVTASITWSILVQRNGLSFCSGISFIIEVLAGGMGRIYDLNSAAAPGAFGSAAEVRWWSTARRRLGIFQGTRVLAVFMAGRALPLQGCALLQAICQAPGFQRKLMLGRG